MNVSQLEYIKTVIEHNDKKEDVKVEEEPKVETNANTDNTVKDDNENNEVKVEKYKRRLKNIKVKLNFLNAAKEYLVQFLDYERMTIIHGRKSHNRLMSEACENFNADTVQISNLFELLLRETTNKATKKAPPG